MLLTKLDELKNISWSTISRHIKKNLNMSYQKIQKVQHKVFSTENARKFIESAILLNCFDKNNTELIFIDEFSFQPRKLVYKGWAKRSSKPFIKRSNESIRYGFIVGLSKQRYYGTIWVKDTVNSNMFLRYMKALVSHAKRTNNDNSDAFIIITDNATYHKTNEIDQFLQRESIKLITIWPYCPWENPAELYINSIKEKIKSLFKLNK